VTRRYRLTNDINTIALKGVISNLLSEESAPYSELNPEEEVEAILTPTGVFSRINKIVRFHGDVIDKTS
jgi:hypothetical protein